MSGRGTGRADAGDYAASTARKRILVVEDEAMIAMLIEDMLEDLGYEIVGPALHIESALRLAQAEPLDAAILDVNMGEEHSYCVARVLEGRGVPFAFATGYGAEGIEPGYEASRVLRKPYLESEVGEVLRVLLAPRGESTSKG